MPKKNVKSQDQKIQKEDQFEESEGSPRIGSQPGI
jgi:hypothetical protein